MRRPVVPGVNKQARGCARGVMVRLGRQVSETKADGSDGLVR